MKKRQTMGKMMRDRELRERRALKQQKKDDRKLAAAEPGSEGFPEGGGADDAAAGDGADVAAAQEPGAAESDGA
jgi:hypothetical protein